MDKLFNDSETFQKERPKKPTKQQLKDLYLRLAKQLKKDGYNHFDNESIIAENLEELYPFNGNGYELAKELESINNNYEIDSSFCEWLDMIDSEYRNVLRENVELWVKAHNPKPKFIKGTKLLINSFLCRSFKIGETVYVNGGSETEATYWINSDPEEYGGTVLAYELVESNCIEQHPPPPGQGLPGVRAGK